MSNIMEFDSKEEMYFSWLLDELGEMGFLLDYETQQPRINLFDGIVQTKYDYKKTKINQKDKSLISGHYYTPDFIIEWDKSAKGILLDNLLEDTGAPFKYTEETMGGIGSIIEIKPNFDKHNMTRAFILNQKWTMQKFNMYVQLIKPKTFFKAFMTPSKYLMTDKATQKRKLAYEPVLLREWINNRIKELERRKGING